jgi:hypothetical protein
MKDGSWVPAMGTDSASWRRLIIGRFNQVSVRMASDSTAMAIATVDSAKHTLTLDDEYLRNSQPRRRTVSGAFVYQTPSPSELILVGRVGADSVRLRFRKVDETQYLLTNRGFHWIQEQPFNR